MDLLLIGQYVLTAIGGVSVILGVIAPLTKSKKDDKVLAFLKKVLSVVSLNVSDKTLGVETDSVSVKIKKK